MVAIQRQRRPSTTTTATGVTVPRHTGQWWVVLLLLSLGIGLVTIYLPMISKILKQTTPTEEGLVVVKASTNNEEDTKPRRIVFEDIKSMMHSSLKASSLGEEDVVVAKDEEEDADEDKKKKQDDDAAGTTTASIIRQIALVGERSCGTRWMTDILRSCFQDDDTTTSSSPQPHLKVDPILTRWKHWFQDDFHDPTRERQPTLVIVQFRNVYDWIEAMRRAPHHASEHMNMNWEDFVTKPWTMERPKYDLPFSQDQSNYDADTTKCRDHFPYNEIIQCHPDSELYVGKHCPKGNYTFACDIPMYELRRSDRGDGGDGGTNEPYQSIIELRSAKIKNWVEEISQWSWVDHVLLVQYEEMLTSGVEELIRQIERVTGRTRNADTCNIPGPQQRRKRELDVDYIDFLNDHVDWETEGLFGYHMVDTTTLVGG